MSVAVALDFSPRFYSADTGRFLQMDPDPGRVSLPISFVNQYAYVGNNPLNYIDPDGEFPVFFFKTKRGYSCH